MSQKDPFKSEEKSSAKRKIKWGSITVEEGQRCRFMIGIRIFIGTVKEITEYNDIVVEDILGQPIIFKPKNLKFFQILNEEQYQKILIQYNQ